MLVHYSTDYVFDGQGTRPYREDDPPVPLGVYGASKLAGERAIEASGCRRFVFRTAWVYGNHGANFMRTMLRLGAEREELRVVADQIGTPTPAALIADVTTRIIGSSSQAYGTFHLTARGQTSWHAFAAEIFENAQRGGLLAKVPRVLPITTAEYPTPARRPAYSCLDTSALQNTFGIALPDWKLGLEQVFAAGSAQD
jgi:dTDP-4-dehydrorhamnose reductase